MAGCVVFAAIVLAEFTPQAGRTVAEKELATPGLVASPSQDHSSKIDQLLTTVLARPLFNVARRPSQRATNDSADDPGLSATRLTGIVTAPGQRVAIFAVTGANLLALTEGETVGDWQIESITPREVSLSGHGTAKRLQPKADEALRSSPEGAAQPPTPTFSRVLPDQQTRDEE